MSKTVRSVASIALPIALSIAAPGIGTALGSTLASSTLAGIGGAVGGAVSGGVINKGGIGGALKGAAIGGVGGYLAGGGAGELLGGTAVGDALGLTAPTAGATVGPIASGATTAMSAGEQGLLNSAAQAANAPIGTAVSGGVARSLGANIGTVGTVLSGANALATANSMDAAKEAAKIQAGAVDKAVATQAPYNELGTDAVAQIKQIQADPGAYVQNNPFYKSLADDAQQRLLASQATKGKIASGGTADALQTSLLNLGNGLVQQQVGTLQNQVNTGQNSANTVSGLQTDKGAVQGAGVVGSSNALQTGYQNQIATLLALQNLSKAPSYQPSTSLRA